MKVAIVILNAAALSLAEKIRESLDNQAIIYVLEGKIDDYEYEFAKISDFVRELYHQNRPIIAICASGIIIRALAPVLGNKAQEPAVLSVAIDGSSVVPLLGVTSGANRLARQIAQVLGAHAAITTSGELYFGLNLLNPPDDLELVNPQDGKKFVSKLLDGANVHLRGAAHDWLTASHLPVDDAAKLQIYIALADEEITPSSDRLVYRLEQFPKSVQRLRTKNCGKNNKLEQFPKSGNRYCGRVTIVGLGPGTSMRRTKAADMALRRADDIFGYGFYVDMAGPFFPRQQLYRSDNGQELERARQALTLAKQGRRVVLVSSGDAGVFGMAAAFFEVLEETTNDYAHIDIRVEPGVTAAMAASSLLGAPLGGDFAIISLSDNLKSQAIIEKRIRLSAQADMAMALYNPLSKARPHQIGRIISILREEKLPTIPVGLGTDIGRADEKILLTTLSDLRLEDITSRTVILVGSSQSRIFHHGGRSWLYTPRFYKSSLVLC